MIRVTKAICLGEQLLGVRVRSLATADSGLSSNEENRLFLFKTSLLTWLHVLLKEIFHEKHFSGPHCLLSSKLFSIFLLPIYQQQLAHARANSDYNNNSDDDHL